MRGYITQRGKKGTSSWTIVIYTGRDPISNKKKYEWHSVKGTKKHAEQEMSKLLTQLDSGTYVKPNKLTVGIFLEQWLRDYAKTNTAPRTFERYAEIIRLHLIPNLGSISLANLKPAHIQAYYSIELTTGRLNGKGGLSQQTVKHHHRVLSEALHHALKWGLVVRNVCDAVDPPKPEKREMHTIQAEDTVRLLDEAKNLEKTGGVPYYTIFYMALHTGMRRGEILALRWNDIDLDMATISVNRSLQILDNRTIIIREPKTQKSKRTIAMTPSLVLNLREFKINMSALKLLEGKSISQDDLIFSHIDGTAYNPDTVTCAFNKIAKRAGFKLRRHDLRHTHATLMLKSGIHPKIVSERLGHSTVAFTLDTYSHVVPGLQEAAAKKFDDMIRLRY
jgi:integrase